MAVPYSTLLTTTLQRYGKQMIDNIFTKTVIMEWFRRKAFERTSGERLRLPLIYATNTSIRWRAKDDTITFEQTDPLTQAEYTWRLCGGAIFVLDVDIDLNEATETQVINLMDAQRQVAELSMKSAIRDAIFGSTFGGNSLDGIRAILGWNAVTGTIDTSNAVGTIDPAVETWWQHKGGDIASSFSANGIDQMLSVYQACSDQDEGTDEPDILICTQSFWNNYNKALQVDQRFASEKEVMWGFPALKFFGASVVWDRGCPANFAWFLNSRYIKYYTVKDVVSKPAQDVPTQFVMASKLYTISQLGITNRRRLGVLVNGDTF